MKELSFLLALLVAGAAYITHLIWSINLLMSDTPVLLQQVALAAIGIFLPFVGAIHGVILWLS